LKETIKNTTLADRLLFLLLISLSIAGMFISKDALSHGTDVLVEIEGKQVYKVPLYVDRFLEIGGPDGSTVVEIQGGRVRVKEAHCRNRLCIREGWVSKGAIVCLPNKIVVFIGGSKKDRQRGIDAISG
jgi:hypothetical protein